MLRAWGLTGISGRGQMGADVAIDAFNVLTTIEAALCTGCDICAQVCPTGAKHPPELNESEI